MAVHMAGKDDGDIGIFKEALAMLTMGACRLCVAVSYHREHIPCLTTTTSLTTTTNIPNPIYTHAQGSSCPGTT